MTTILDRTKQPDFKQIDKIDIVEAKKDKLSNNIPFYTIEAGTQDVVRIDFIFNSGSWQQKKPLLASTTNSMIDMGTSTMTASEIAAKTDFYGAYLQFNTDHHFSSVSLYSLNKHLENTISILKDILKDAIFPQNEFETLLSRRRQSFIVNSEKVKNISRKLFIGALYGTAHPYGKVAELEDYENLKRDEIVEYFAENYIGANCTIVAAGKINNNLYSIVDKHFGDNEWLKTKTNRELEIPIITANEKFHFQEKDDAVQSSIRIGKIICDRSNPDFLGLRVLNTILGGYFGSRLMANIREDKGYTYGIYSMLTTLKNSAYFSIVSEVGADVCKNAIEEIYKELNRLRTQLIAQDELNLVKNYMLGEIQRQFDGPFALSDSLQFLLEYNLEYSYFDDMIKTVRKITAPQLQELAQKYFNENEMFQAIAGKM